MADTTIAAAPARPARSRLAATEVEIPKKPRQVTVWKLENNAWCCQQAGAGDSNRRRMLRRQEAGGYEVVGRVIRISKAQDLEARQ